MDLTEVGAISFNLKINELTKPFDLFLKDKYYALVPALTFYI
jgi:hypothetical protein